MRKKLVGFGCAVALGVSATLIATPAEAATLEICNSAFSDDNITVYRISSPFQDWNIHPGFCANTNNSGGAVRVDVDPPGGSADIDSWRKWRANDNPNNYPCFNNEDGASNPYNDYTNWYRTSRWLNCAE